MTTKKLVVFVHRLYYNGKPKKGGLDLIIDYLVTKGYEVFLFEFPLNYAQSKKLFLRKLTSLGYEILEEIELFTVKSSVNWFIEVILCLYWSFKHNLYNTIVASADPLMSLPAVLLRKLGFYKFHYYHSVDYSPVRFPNTILNYIYLKLLLIGMQNADLVGVVTKRALDRIKKFDINSMLYIPNSPSFKLSQKHYVIPDSREKSLVVTCAEISDKYKILEICKLFWRLKQNHSELSLNIIGHFDYTNEYVDKISSYLRQNVLESSVNFCGYTDRENNLKLLGKSYIGLAFYDDHQYTHVIYGDSLKIREYAVLGLPTVADASTSTSYEMSEEKAGFMVLDENEAFEAIEKLLKDEHLYYTMSENAHQWALKVDKDKLLGEFFDILETK